MLPIWVAMSSVMLAGSLTRLSGEHPMVCFWHALIPLCHPSATIILPLCFARYPIHTPREACYGDMNGFPGVRNYGVVDPEDMYDVYCYAEDVPGACGAPCPTSFSQPSAVTQLVPLAMSQMCSAP